MEEEQMHEAMAYFDAAASYIQAHARGSLVRVWSNPPAAAAATAEEQEEGGVAARGAAAASEPEVLPADEMVALMADVLMHEGASQPHDEAEAAELEPESGLTFEQELERKNARRSSTDLKEDAFNLLLAEADADAEMRAEAAHSTPMTEQDSRLAAAANDRDTRLAEARLTSRIADGATAGALPRTGRAESAKAARAEAEVTGTPRAAKAPEVDTPAPVGAAPEPEMQPVDDMAALVAGVLMDKGASQPRDEAGAAELEAAVLIIQARVRGMAARKGMTEASEPQDEAEAAELEAAAVLIQSYSRGLRLRAQ
ncbi:hypothetical protein T492DRAFT_866531, partial [Pavlovales sp. CCMP2436]